MEEKIKKFLLFTGIIICVVLCLAPFVFMLIVSFCREPDFLSDTVPFIFTAGNYITVGAGKNLYFMEYLRNSLVISFITALITIIIAAPAAYAASKMRLWGKTAFLAGAIAVSMFPQISIAGYLFKMMTSAGIINTYPALILPYTAWVLPLTLWILTGYFSQIPPAINKAALCDGATHFQVLYRVLMPVAAPGVFSSFLLAFIFAFNEFMFALILTADQAARTVPVGIALFTGMYGRIPWGEVMAASVITVIPVAVLVIVFNKYIVDGLTKGAVKE